MAPAILSPDPPLPGSSFLPFVSSLCGWVYFLCWSASFYPQPTLNFRRGTTRGTTIDFPLINIIGFLAYLSSNLAFYSSPLIRAQYAARHRGLTPTVQLNDVVFAAHALLMCLVIYSQYVPSIWGFPRTAGTRPSRAILGLSAGCVAGVGVVACVVLADPRRGDTGPAAREAWNWLDVVYAVSYVKLIVTVVKYTPQMVWNYRNKSTRGWSIEGMMLDFTGGVLSLVQLAIDSYLQGDWSGITGNPVKFGLGNVSMIYDLIFFTQHWVLYRGAEGKEAETDSLLAEEAEEERRIE
ncbi:Lysosomal cystine transporter [Coniochaeta hoffmannii]|uniref:Lysosomal cystine transporter n=1 Tax=Coniochaeta hoffmannii TaxID=91930 RepID=A0AA38W2A0_9PEZI|nr:Lysosomal cystine transporter [Coniochaeta hoffmannii]